MNAQAILAEVSELSVSERILLVEDLWDSIASNPQDLPVTNTQRAELDRRLGSVETNPKAGSTWAEVRHRIEST